MSIQRPDPARSFHVLALLADDARAVRAKDAESLVVGAAGTGNALSLLDGCAIVGMNQGEECSLAIERRLQD